MKRSIKLKNAKIRIRYLAYLKGPKRMVVSTIRIKERYIAEFERLISGRDFATFNINIAERYKKYLNDYQWNGKHLHKKTAAEKLSTIRAFFTWLSDQAGYKSKINKTDADYLQLDNASMSAIRTSVNVQDIPGIDDVKKLVHSIELNTELDLRDKALISFILLSGLRASSITTIKLKDFNTKKLTITLNVLEGAKTKYSKSNTVRLLVFDDSFLDPIIKWYNFLIIDKKFTDEMPLFPMTDMKNAPGTYKLEAFEVKPESWSSAGAINKIIKDRSINAGLHYYHPHLFRGLHTSIALSYARGGREMLAISRNLGHENIKTTIAYYGFLDVRTQVDTLSKINFKKRMNEDKDNNKSEFEEMVEKISKKIVKEILDESRKSNNQSDGNRDNSQ